MVETIKGRKILVTGATGLVGSYLVEKLVDSHSEVACLVRDEVPTSLFFLQELDKKVSMIRGDLVDPYLVERAIIEYEIELIFHLGAQTIVTTAYHAPVQTFEQNIKGTWNILEAARKHSVKGVIVASSDKAYGSARKLPYTEDSPMQGRQPYDVSKSCGDLIAQSYYHAYKLPVAIARCGNIFGGGDLNFSRLIPGTIKSFYYNEKPVIRSDGNYIRDYIFVLDAIDAYLALSKNILNNKFCGEAFNFSYGHPYKVIEVVNKIKNLMNKQNIEPELLNIASNEIKEQWLSCDKARRLLKWKGQYNLEEGLKRTINWYVDFFKNTKA